MKIRIHYELPNWDEEDYFNLEGDTPEEIRNKADRELAIRGGINPWSEVLSE